MEGSSSDLKLEETRKPEDLDEIIKAVIVPAIEVLDLEPESVCQISIGGNDESFRNGSSNDKEEGPVEKSPKVVDLENLEAEEEKEVSESVEDNNNSLQPVNISEDPVTILEAAVKNSVLSDVLDSAISVKTDEGVKKLEDEAGIEESNLPSSGKNDGSSVVLTDVEESKRGGEYIALPSLEEKREVSLYSKEVLVKGVEESNGERSQDVEKVDLQGAETTKFQGSDENPRELSVDEEYSKGISPDIGQVAASSNGHAAIPTANGSSNKHELPDSVGNNPPVISVTRRTSWLGCCGLVEVLRRSDRR